MLSYAGVNLAAPTAENAAWVRANIPYSALADSWRRSWPEIACTHLSYRGPQVLLRQAWSLDGAEPQRPVESGKLFWPVGAARFALGHYLASDNQLAAIRTAIGAGGSAPLVLNDGKRPSLSINLWLLPARPLAQIAGSNGLNLLSLCDQRFFFWHQAANISITDGTTTWLQLYTAIAAALGIALAVDTIPAAYGTPPDMLTSHYRPLPLLMDAVCRSVGQRFVAGLDGSFRAMNAGSAAALQTSNLAGVGAGPKLAGGQFAFA